MTEHTKLSNQYAIDGGVLIALALNEPAALSFKEKILHGEIHLVTHHYALTELLYVLCRAAGMQEAQKKLQLVMQSNVVTIIPPEPLLQLAAREKCDRSLAIADCFTIALATLKSYVALFAKKERELLDSANLKPFTIPIQFLEEFG